MIAMNRFLFAVAWTAAAFALPILIDSAVKGFALLGAAAVAILVLRRASASVRHLVWVSTTAALLALPLLLISLPEWRVLPAWVNVSIPAAVEPGNTPTAAAIGTRKPDVASPSAYETLANSSDPSVAAAGVHADRQADALVPGEARRYVHPHVAVLATAVWATGVVVLCMRLALSKVCLSRLARKATPVAEGRLYDMAEALRPKLGVRRTVRLMSSDRRDMPMTWGIFRARLLLPSDAEDWEDDRLRAVLKHELGHIRRYDALAQLLVRLACALYWFNPLVWVAAWRVRVEHERACDDLVLAAGTHPSDYASHLLAIATGYEERGLAHVSGIGMAKKSRLEGRLMSVLNGKLNRNGLTRAAVGACLLTVATAVLPVAMMRSADHEPRTTLAAEDDQPRDLHLVLQREDAASEPRDDAGADNSVAQPHLADFTLDDIARVAGLSADETAAVRRFIDGNLLGAGDLEVLGTGDRDDTLQLVARLANLTSDETEAVDELVSRGQVRDMDSLQEHRDSAAATQPQKAAIDKLAALWRRQTAVSEKLQEARQMPLLTKTELSALDKLRRALNFRSVPTVFTVRQVFQPGEGGQTSWTALQRHELEDGRITYMAFVHAAPGGRFPVRLAKEDRTRFEVGVRDGSDAQLEVEVLVRTGPQEREATRILTLERDKPVEIQIDGEWYSLVFASAYIGRWSPHISREAQIIVYYKPEQEEHNPAQDEKNAGADK